MRKNWWLIPVAILGYIGYRKFVLSRSINVFFKGFDFSSITLLNPVVKIKVQVNNPTTTTAEIQNIRGDLQIDGVFVGSVQGVSAQTIVKGVNIIDIPITLSYMGIADLISKFNRKGFRLDFTGAMVVDFIPIPLQFNYAI
jgi:LEA14-like dessication related protein